MSKLIIITLTDSAPVRVRADDWPVIAKDSWHEGQFACQANRSCWLQVRKHADGRALVYGQYSTTWGGEDDISAGELCEADADLVAAIRRVAEEIGAPASCIRGCIADLPAVDLDEPDRPGRFGIEIRD